MVFLVYPKSQHEENEVEFWEKHWQKRCNYIEEHGTPWQFDGYWQNKLYKRKIGVFNRLVGDARSKKILEPGAGCEIVSLAQVSRRAQVDLLELSDSAIRYMKMVRDYIGLESEPRIYIGKGDLFDLPYEDNTFDITWNSGVIEHYDFADKAIIEMKRVTKPGGNILVAVPNLIAPELLANQFKNRRGTEHYFSQRSLKNFLENQDLADVSVETVPQVLPSTTGDKYIKRFERYEPLLGIFGMIHFAKGTKKL